MSMAEPAAITAPTKPRLRNWIDALPASFRRVVVPFALSRLLVLVIFSATPLLQQSIATGDWGKNDRMSIRISPDTIAAGFARVAIANDAAFYYGIAKEGYEQRPFDTSRAANWAFFPLHPLLWRAAAAVTGEWLWSGVLLANLFAISGFCLLWSLAHRLTRSIHVADNAILFASFWPSTYFMVLPHSESLFMFLATASLLAAFSNRIWTASLFGAAAGATRVNGLFLAPAIFVGQWFRGKRCPGDVAKLVPFAGGLAIFMAYLWIITGNPLAFKDIQSAWGRSFHAPWVALLDYVNRPLKIAMPWNPRLIHFVTVLIAFASAMTCWRRGWRELAVFTLLTILAPLCTGTLMSMTRYIGVAPGIFIALAVWTEDRPRAGMLWLAASAVTMALLCVLFALPNDIGGA